MIAADNASFDPLLFLLEKYYEITLSQNVHTINFRGSGESA
jgi:hypothetical protein